MKLARGEAAQKRELFLNCAKRHLARKKHLHFMYYCWAAYKFGIGSGGKAAKFTPGLHTEGVCQAIDKAIEKYKEGQSSFLIVKIPVRHGKSDIVSRFLPAHFIGECPGSEVMVTAYAAELASGFTQTGFRIATSKEYAELYPEVKIDARLTSGRVWDIQKPQPGRLTASGLMHGLVGKGYGLGIVDDYCGSRKEAESEVVRENTWKAFTDDFLTRRAPVSITIIVASPWHVDDLIGRCEKAMEEDENFPKFETVKYPAKSDNYETGYLFPERYGKDWYETQFSVLGIYGAASLLQCDPARKGGNMLNVSNVIIDNTAKHWPAGLKWYRVVDFAHSKKERVKDDPDYTSATLCAFSKKEDIWSLYIKHVWRTQDAITLRDKKLGQIIDLDAPDVHVVFERTTDSLDACDLWKARLDGKRIVKEWRPDMDKVVRASYLEPIFDAGNVHILRGEWNQDWFDEIAAFPMGAHDDQVDNIGCGFQIAIKGLNQKYSEAVDSPY